jgi:hypothetical protein
MGGGCGRGLISTPRVGSLVLSVWTLKCFRLKAHITSLAVDHIIIFSKCWVFCVVWFCLCPSSVSGPLPGDEVDAPEDVALIDPISGLMQMKVLQRFR